MSQVGLLITQQVYIDAETIINIVGSVSQHPCSFDVNLFASDDGSDVALNFSAQFADKVVITRSKKNGTWSGDEPAGRFPFVSDETFVLTIVTTPDSHAIKVNGELLHSFTHKLPFDSIKRLSISEEATGDDPSIRIIYASVQDSSGIPTIFKNQISTPYDRPVNLSAGNVIRVCGSVSRDPDSFSTSLLALDSQVAFHCTVKFDDKTIVMNAKTGGVWGEEERSSIFPFTRREAFVAVIRVENEGYEIVINGQHVHLFKHRISLDQVQRFVIDGPPQDRSLPLYLGHVSVRSVMTAMNYGGRVIFFWSKTNGGSLLAAHDKKTVTGGGGYTTQSQFTVIAADSGGIEYYLQNMQYPESYLAIQHHQVTLTTKQDSSSKFKISHGNDDNYRLFNRSEEKYIAIEKNGTTKAVPENEKCPDTVFSVLQKGFGPDVQSLHSPGFYLWNKESGGNLQLVLQSNGESYTVLGGGGQTPQAQIQFIRVPGDGDIESVYALRSKLFPKMYLAFSDEDNTVIAVRREGLLPFPRWRMDWNSEGFYTIPSADAPNKFISVEKNDTVVVSDGEHPTDKIKFQVHFCP